PHHECEIAQTEACTGKPFARYWVHNGMVNMGKEKMSKSLGNTLNIREIVKRHDPDALRLWMLGAHYRNMIEWSEERVGESARAPGAPDPRRGGGARRWRSDVIAPGLRRVPPALRAGNGRRFQHAAGARRPLRFRARAGRGARPRRRRPRSVRRGRRRAGAA